MRVLTGSPDCEVPPGFLLSDLVRVNEGKPAAGPMIQSIKERTGKKKHFVVRDQARQELEKGELKRY